MQLTIASRPAAIQSPAPVVQPVAGPVDPLLPKHFPATIVAPIKGRLWSCRVASGDVLEIVVPWYEEKATQPGREIRVTILNRYVASWHVT